MANATDAIATTDELILGNPETVVADAAQKGILDKVFKSKSGPKPTHPVEVHSAVQHMVIPDKLLAAKVSQSKLIHHAVARQLRGRRLTTLVPSEPIDLNDDGYADTWRGPNRPDVPMTDDEQRENDRRHLNTQEWTMYHGSSTMGLTGYTWNKASIHAINRSMALPTLAQLRAVRAHNMANMPYGGRQWVPIQDGQDWYHVAADTLYSTLAGSAPDPDLPYNGAIYYTNYPDYETSWDRYPDGFNKYENVVDMGPSGSLNMGYYGVVVHEPAQEPWEQIDPTWRSAFYDLILNNDPNAAWHPVGSGGAQQNEGYTVQFVSALSYTAAVETPPVPTATNSIDTNNPPSYVNLGAGPSGTPYHLIYAVTYNNTRWYKVDVNDDGSFSWPGDHQITMYELAQDLGFSGPAAITPSNRDGILNGYAVRLPTVEEMWVLYATTYRTYFQTADYTWAVGNDPADPTKHCGMLPWASFNGNRYYQNPNAAFHVVLGFVMT